MKQKDGFLRLASWTAALAVVPALFSASATAQTAWPSKTMRIVVPYPAGGNVDLLGRLIGPKLSEALGQTIVIDNKPGAAGAIGATDAARSEPDGHTLLIGDIATHAITPALQDKLPYNPLTDFAPVMRLTSVSLLLVINPKNPAKDLAALLADAKANPEKVTYASAGVGTPQQLAFELLKEKTGIKATHVPYRGSAPAINDVIAGHVTAMIDGTAVPMAREGTLRALAVTGAKRSAAMPDVPTVAEAGVPGYEFVSWHGVFVPAGTPPAVVERLNAELNKIVADPAVRERMAALNIELVGGTSAAFGDFIKAESGKIAELVRISGAKAN
ncbi:Bug family tripartite tricarboxylate transporter substrate binding protein [Bosea rubneri]|uniref:Tripartite tricarboxylate transporter substrate binding protein n=1 Tax=Bosea rubneri TaxID=3075434 RepID=A0ABU3SD63_9HYPH|nr:tripartite tricarboxylate transporter substrate binding protein [Bosea sp. ZW T0_25]MDU0342725.1 tripartite tricarboxylate transporter substrate binding protein [Bosea sp. ZW T0_25]